VEPAAQPTCQYARSPLLKIFRTAIDILKALQETKEPAWAQVYASKERAVGLLPLVAFAVTNETQVDSLEALKSVLLEKSP